MKTNRIEFSVPEHVSARFRTIGNSTIKTAEDDGFRSSQWQFEEDLSAQSGIIDVFLRSISPGQKVYFINLNEADRSGEENVMSDDFLIPYSESGFREVFEDSIFAAMRIISPEEGTSLVASFMDWGMLVHR
ncbi:hypothetical protein HME9302_00092 [Alteripontixanthobacter maritimus]|uniref:Uncharacterized protein n=1 Tax=Alteripontixanthobacter maritimus TaxID=2161824 RepID=A0A369Q6Z6_9SPHN|nr:hypothetical protein [Alteripontixanthobacter maritimus]RDC58916.1 hypothetical protein HME9302_00092 [Alteripontixanthobacter maritimus]